MGRLSTAQRLSNGGLSLNAGDTLEKMPGTEDRVILSMGPQHPSTHGVLRLVLELEGETVIRAIYDIGYLHTGFEKTFESKTYSAGNHPHRPDGLPCASFQ